MFPQSFSIPKHFSIPINNLNLKDICSYSGSSVITWNWAGKLVSAGNVKVLIFYLNIVIISISQGLSTLVTIQTKMHRWALNLYYDF